MKRPNFVALAASVAIAAAALGGFHSTSTTVAPLAMINGTPVTDLAPIVVHPDTGADLAAL